MADLNERLAAAKDNAVLQAQIWAQEARTQRATVLDILRYFGLPEHDYEALRLIRQRMENIAAEWDECHIDAPGGEIEVGPAIRRSFVMNAYGVTDTRDARPLGCALAMRIMQSELYQQLDETERADCDELVQQNLEWFKRDSAVGAPGCECTRPMVPVGRTCLKCGGIADGVTACEAPQEDTMGVIGGDGQKHHLFRTRAEEDAAVARSPLKVGLDLVALAERVGGVPPQLYECAECSQPDCNWRGECDGESCPACGGHVVPSGVMASDGSQPE